MEHHWPKDIREMHEKFGHTESAKELRGEVLQGFYRFRLAFLEEEMTELSNSKCPEDSVDALIDLCVVAIGTLDIFGVDASEAWRRVHERNMQKQAGSNLSRPNQFGLPDLIKPEGWESPDHEGNVGRLVEIIFE